MDGFERHVKEEHNQWAYVFFFIHLDETRPNDYTALELLANQKYNFFPINRALGLQQEEDDNEARLQKMTSYITYLEAARVREDEQKQQKALEKAHRGELRPPKK
ncbi:hypothetical protein LSAT2_006887 [Lamellibrachia satsuma]|nr:hypothetical protein LSAT2_006887 [Lamellibrachia satsuma]